ncbi:hypothetical protein [Actinosynnema sp. ALI-1.44]|uniref:hypothetical protein n=1 Tax=Actinosynnema sp. ALI-1.44 TaxID=1933779 RepID=UPI001177870C|nr:hypothetical protein [Actinosynnema sp. ALI-1.44]
MSRRFVCGLIAVAAFTGGSAVAPVAVAAESQQVGVASSVTDWVQRWAMSDPRALVRAAAWRVLLAEDPDAASAEFFASGYTYAKNLAASHKEFYADFCQRVLDTHTREYSPEVYAAARFAVNSPDDVAREQFANGGFEAAQQRDSAVREKKGEQAKAVVETDRAVVRNLAVNDPGAQVRASAAFAVRAGATDRDLVDFFADGWAFGSRLDLDRFREQSGDNEVEWRAPLPQLTGDAQAAEKTARETPAGPGRESAKSAAVRAWQSVAEYTTQARVYWDDAHRRAGEQTANWGRVHATATATGGPNWSAMITPARSAETEWRTETGFAQDQGTYWAGIRQQAIDGEQRVRAL